MFSIQTNSQYLAVNCSKLWPHQPSVFFVDGSGLYIAVRRVFVAVFLLIVAIQMAVYYYYYYYYNNPR